MKSTSLKLRIAKSAFGLSFVVCLLFSAGLYIAFEYAEESLLEEHYEADMNTFMQQYLLLPEIAALPRENFSVYIAENNDRSHFPEHLRNLAIDEEDVEHDGRLLDVERRERGDYSFYFVSEETAINSFENILFSAVLIIILIVSIISVLLAFGFAKRIIKPLTELAKRVDQLENTSPSLIDMSAENNDEIAVLSTAIDSYQNRVGELLAREREFSSDTSHELRTPLMGILSAAENLQIANTDERTLELAQRIEARCKQMQALVDAMLFLARDPHSMENDFGPVELISIVKDQLESARPHIESKAVEIQLEDKDSPLIQSSAAILSVIFGNLLRNAVIHSHSTKILIQIDKQGFTIQDFGQGIEADLQERMFERFSNGHTDSNQGIGIGLSLVKRLCDHFKWKLLVESESGTGTSISIDFQTSLLRSPA